MTLSEIRLGSSSTITLNESHSSLGLSFLLHKVEIVIIPYCARLLGDFDELEHEVMRHNE